MRMSPMSHTLHSVVDQTMSSVALVSERIRLLAHRIYHDDLRRTTLFVIYVITIPKIQSSSEQTWSQSLSHCFFASIRRYRRDHASRKSLMPVPTFTRPVQKQLLVQHTARCICQKLGSKRLGSQRKVNQKSG
ncbi:hypothetical protein HBI56_037190 [Parastagonospora nodorum]|uniref:Uncharacterized protein n=1 Tax=Phaeosphaeria nodorum (strain SN15 / ATCC MYA-4574 / FGSC 10173) TaxID=321614 RepID=A0A7U2EVF2_PHANO|nr:hypothetical protein HBH56_069620 [Parastagonospora nodorum]QRC93602.1 hypothetical protein JI435_404160 [Parastagonospora nodorum SN15]KAH3932214.1 hypothetical protein HBH54_078510 [Parastagonospora nodorum]KAH3955030.1 hypothetical protein HBH53_015860 [Parastagonospora nodorum]KAH3986419.1 hypothetical protein HBH52_047020 [Parastagonospora nodorum]